MPVNIEIKARCPDHARIRRTLKEHNAEFRGTDRQTDTYFNANCGRLKLRQGDIENALIGYDRPDDPEPKKSRFALYRSVDPALLKRLLTDSLGVLIAVQKTREIYYIGNVKFHLDRVDGLGEFVEIEATDGGGDIDERQLREQCARYMDMFNIHREDLMTDSYSDMLLRAEGAP